MMMRGFGFNVTFILMFLMVIGMFLGVSLTTPENSGLYGVAILFLLTLTLLFEYAINYFITT